MTPEEKNLLLQDLCARLPYNLVVQIEGCGIWNLRGIDHDNSTELRDRVIVWHGKNYPSSKNSFPIINCKPYLFPLSSMNPKQKSELSMLTADSERMFDSTLIEIDFYHKHHFDYRGLIPMGLANDATGLNVY